MRKLPKNRQSPSLLLVACLFAIALLSSCDSASSYQYVDFQDNVEVDRPSETAPIKTPLKVAVAAMISPRETFAYYQALLDYLTAKMDQPIELVQRKTYGEINALFLKKQLDLAFICSGPYAMSKDIYGFEALATPQIRGKPTYQS